MIYSDKQIPSAEIKSLVVKKIGLNSGSIHIEPCYEGGNNRSFIVTNGVIRFFAKQYFRHPSDTRDRFASERAFLSYAAKSISCVPQLLDCDETAGIALYEFIEGRKLKAAEINRDHIHAAADFFLTLNSCAEQAQDIGVASEACFSVDKHIALIEKRIQRLSSISATTPIDTVALTVVEDIRRRWNKERQFILKMAPILGLDISIPLPAEAHCISPSDFGFHNALLRPNGGLCFLDFEYAGWDDPAKMIGDFFCQPAVPIAPHFWEEFSYKCSSFSPHRDQLIERAKLLLPLFRIKWCCIMLNEFLPNNTRQFAQPKEESYMRKQRQLERVQNYINERL